jgi:hypothetical protein
MIRTQLIWKQWPRSSLLGNVLLLDLNKIGRQNIMICSYQMIRKRDESPTESISVPPTKGPQRASTEMGKPDAADNKSIAFFLNYVPPPSVVSEFKLKSYKSSSTRRSRHRLLRSKPLNNTSCLFSSRRISAHNPSKTVRLTGIQRNITLVLPSPSPML